MNTPTVLFSVLATLVTGIWTVYKHFEAQSADRRRADFEAFHKMVACLPVGGTQPISPQVVLATLYELRNYPQYFDVTARILKLYAAAIPNDPPDGSLAGVAFKEMADEVTRTLDYIKRKSGHARCSPVL